MNVSVDSTKCIGCGLCVSMAEEVFEIVEGVSQVKPDAPLQDSAVQQKANDAAAVCCNQAIVVEES
ncbi:ferredoxin [Candidatus Roizmanbacteria bacterium]|nr:ferredoxin [Candidatus Roizmanbacteria bacterium]